MAAAALGARVQGPCSASYRRTREGRWCWGGRAARAGGQWPGLGRRRACGWWQQRCVALRASGRGVLGWSGASASSASAAAGRQQGSERGRAAAQRGSSGAAAAGGSAAALLCSRVPGVKEEREGERRERSKRVDFKFSQNFQLKLQKL